MARSYGQQAYASGGFRSFGGTAQASLYVLRNETTNSAMTELFLDGQFGDQRMKIPAGSTWVFEVLVVARTQDPGGIGPVAMSAGFRIRGVIQNDGGGTTMYGASGEPLYRADNSWNVWAIEDDTHDALTIVVQGGSRPMRWVATVRTSEVMFQ